MLTFAYHLMLEGLLNFHQRLGQSSKFCCLSLENHFVLYLFELKLYSNYLWLALHLMLLFDLVMLFVRRHLLHLLYLLNIDRDPFTKLIVEFDSFIMIDLTVR